MGLAFGEGGFLTVEKLNWSLYPLFFIICGLLIKTSWHLYIEAWNSLPSNNVIYRKNVVERRLDVIKPTVKLINKARVPLIFASVLFGFLLSAIDAWCLWFEYGILRGDHYCSENDFSIAFKLESYVVSKFSNGIFVVAVYTLQSCLISMGLIALFQIILHGYFFLFFEKIESNKKSNIEIKLNINDRLGEFGLTEVNRALNTNYIFIAVAMTIPVLSAFSQPEGVIDHGQWLLRLLLPLLLLAPLAIPYYDRFFRVKEASDRAKASASENDAEDFKKQSLFPFEGTQLGYLGKTAAAIALAQYIYLFTNTFF